MSQATQPAPQKNLLARPVGYYGVVEFLPGSQVAEVDLIRIRGRQCGERDGSHDSVFPYTQHALQQLDAPSAVVDVAIEDQVGQRLGGKAIELMRIPELPPEDLLGNFVGELPHIVLGHRTTEVTLGHRCGDTPVGTHQLIEVVVVAAVLGYPLIPAFNPGHWGVGDVEGLARQRSYGVNRLDRDPDVEGINAGGISLSIGDRIVRRMGLGPDVLPPLLSTAQPGDEQPAGLQDNEDNHDSRGPIHAIKVRPGGCYLKDPILPEAVRRLWVQGGIAR